MVALRLHRRQSDGTMSKVNIILIFLVHNAVSLSTTWRVVLGIS